MNGTLYLIPTTLGETPITQVIPAYVIELIYSIKEFIVEDEKTARRYLKKIGIPTPLDQIILHPLNNHTPSEEISSYLNAIKEGKNIGIISDAGCPGIADPGAEIVKLAHERKIKVVPLVGPSSILLALMASGLNGQHFTFHGYLPKDRNERIKKLKDLEKTSQQKNQTQLFIETPYRNQHLLEDILGTCNGQTQLCIACDITLETEFIVTKPIHAWKGTLPDLTKRPSIFLIHAS